MGDVSVAAAAKAPKRPKVTTSTSSVVEGNVIRVRAKVYAGKRARRATLQRARVDVWGKTRWEAVRSKKVKGKQRRVTFKTTVTDKNRARYRVSVTYKNRKKPRISKVARVQVWRWIPLHNYRAYYTAGGTNGTHGIGSASINGQSYRAWGPYASGTMTSWEDRFTPGRNCRSFRGVAGVTDLSDDGATGTISLRADGAQVWQSPVLEPGTAVNFRVPLKSKPYRFAILGANTSADDLKAWPAIGDPAFLCTGV